MLDTGSAVYIKISEKEKQGLLPLLVLLGQSVIFKYPSGPVYKGQVYDINKLGHLLVKKPLQELSSIDSAENPLLSFELEHERYFAKFPMKILSQCLLFETTGDMYVIKRRRFRRVKFPEFFPVKAIIKEMAGRKVFMEARILDVSAKGARFILPHQLPRLKAQQRLRVNINLQGRNSLEFTSVIRHHKVQQSSFGDQQQFGVEFIDMDRSTEKRLFTYLTSLEAEIFNRWLKR